jgi:hypothetical protein
VDGSLFDVNGWYTRLARARRLIARHLKDADRIPLPARGTKPCSQEHVRPRGDPRSRNAQRITRPAEGHHPIRPRGVVLDRPARVAKAIPQPRNAAPHARRQLLGVGCGAARAR